MLCKIIALKSVYTKSTLCALVSIGFLLGLWVAQAGGCREKPAADAGNTSSWFTEITKDAGLTFTYDNGASGGRLMPEIMGSGVALFDFDNDGDLDLYLTNGNHTLGNPTPPGPAVADRPRNALFRHEPDGRFVDVTGHCGLGDAGYGMGVAVGNINNDGYADVYVTNLGNDHLYQNRGDGTFEDVSKTAGIEVDGWSASACFFDYDLDGFLDLYVTQYLAWNPRKTCSSPDGRPDYCGPLSFPPIHDVLLHNNGNGTFTDVSQRAGMASVAAAGLGVVSTDVNGDGRPDLYIANDAYANQLWINQGDGTFYDAAVELGAAYNLDGVAESGMGVVAADFDGDGRDDFFLTHMTLETNTLYRNLGKSIGFVDGTGQAGLSWSSTPYTGFGVAALDVEFDGDLDLVVVNGKVRHGKVLPGAAVGPRWNLFAEPNLFYTNTGIGRFEWTKGPVTASLCERVEITRGLAVGDIDSDGDVDLVLSNIQSPARLYRNDAPRQGAWIAVRTVDPRLHRDAIGARVAVVCSGRRFTRVITRSWGYLSSSDPRAYFGLGAANAIDRIEVNWPDGLRERFPASPVNRFVVLIRGKGEKR